MKCTAFLALVALLVVGISLVVLAGNGKGPGDGICDGTGDGICDGCPGCPPCDGDGNGGGGNGNGWGDGTGDGICDGPCQ